jgi:uncharacterized Zn finger protein
MLVRACPNCAETTARALSDDPAESVFYYRCTQCGHVWHRPKNDPDAPLTTVMPGRLPGRRLKPGNPAT